MQNTYNFLLGLNDVNQNNEPDEDNLKVSTPIKTYTRTRSDIVELIFPSPSSNISSPLKTKITDIIQMPSPNLKRKSKSIEEDTPKKLKLKEKNKTIHNKITHISKLKKKVSRFNMSRNLNSLLCSHQFPSNNSKAMVTMQLKNKRRPWSIIEKNLALGLFYKSPTAYKFLRLQKVNLPGP